MKVLFALIGAIVAPVLLFILVLIAAGPRAPDNWDWVTPALTLAALPFVCVTGAVAGAMIAGARAAGDPGRIKSIVVGALAIVLVLPAFLFTIRMWPTPSRRPTTEAERAAWVDTWRARSGDASRIDAAGYSVARTLRACILSHTTRDCSENDRFYGDGEDSLVARFAYGIDDDGWRWLEATGEPAGRIVFLDPRLGRAGPVYELRGPDILRRATPRAPRTSTDRQVAALLNFPPCLIEFARVARERGLWDGTASSLPHVLADQWSTPAGCPNVILRYRPEYPGDPWQFYVVGDGVNRHVKLRPDTSDADSPFRYQFEAGARTFTREANGTWYMGGGPMVGYDKAEPPRCFFEVGTACPG